MLTQLRPARFKLMPVRTITLCVGLLAVDVLTNGPVAWILCVHLLLPLCALPVLILRSLQTRGVPPRAALRVLVLGGTAATSSLMLDHRKEAVREAAAPVIEAVDAYEAQHGEPPARLEQLVEAGLLETIPHTGLLSPLHRDWAYSWSTRRPHACLSATSSVLDFRSLYCFRRHKWML